MKFRAVFAAPLFFAGTAYAQPADINMDDTVFDETYVTIGLGGSYGPSYDGSDDYVFSVLPIVTGSVEGIEFQPRGPGVAFDVIPDKDGAAVDFIFGPVITVNLDRTRQIEDVVVETLGELDTAVEIGGTAGLQFNRVLNPFDSVSAAIDVKWDVAGAHDGMIVSPWISYFTPVSRGAAINVTFTAEHVDDDYADYYYSITPAGSVVSGLPQFQAEGGWRSVGVTTLLAVDLDGDITNGGFGLFALGGYSRLLEDAKRSPITSIRGDADQWFGALGVGYTF